MKKVIKILLLVGVIASFGMLVYLTVSEAMLANTVNNLQTELRSQANRASKPARHRSAQKSSTGTSTSGSGTSQTTPTP